MTQFHINSGYIMKGFYIASEICAGIKNSEDSGLRRAFLVSLKEKQNCQIVPKTQDTKCVPVLKGLKCSFQ